MPIPTPEEQVTFLVKFQRLLTEGGFVASYKYALLLALADLSVELGDNSGAAQLIPLHALAEKFITYYWRQTVPYPAPGAKGRVLVQNTAKQATIVQRVTKVREQFEDKLPHAKNDARAWQVLIGDVTKVIKKMPLWRLQFEQDRFLYEHQLRDKSIELRSGVVFCFRKFHELLDGMVRSAWVRYLRGLKANQAHLGQAQDLDEFLFGSERSNLKVYRPIFTDVQRGKCFYCQGALVQQGAVDHFIPWSRYPVDFGHNFVLAHQSCNGAKTDHLAAFEHLERWFRRNEDRGLELEQRFADAGVVRDLVTSQRVTRWAYEKADAVGAHVWVKGTRLQALDPKWKALLGETTE